MQRTCVAADEQTAATDQRAKFLQIEFTEIDDPRAVAAERGAGEGRDARCGLAVRRP